jgi:hypothetical protein
MLGRVAPSRASNTANNTSLGTVPSAETTASAHHDQQPSAAAAPLHRRRGRHRNCGAGDRRSEGADRRRAGALDVTRVRLRNAWAKCFSSRMTLITRILQLGFEKPLVARFRSRQQAIVTTSGRIVDAEENTLNKWAGSLGYWIWRDGIEPWLRSCNSTVGPNASAR